MTRLDPTGTVDLLREILADTPRLDAACAHPKRAWLFDPAERDEPVEEVRRRQTMALALCRQCPPIEACRAWADSLPPAQRVYGVVAGEVRERPKQRRKAKR
ncbi:WhiB family transcriptional regulator [Mycolicibacillus parakoreensis]|uniref:WhiB family transcriptional regulator n=1 Tax=Mycolicibacillus parakoreensis TaxID=1069221 RepID=A0ABY3TV62_9MYCO|nr:WhiB family transcriptional regulator [Mycolicibacillus parakoreensis]MCV7317255.1 WhiB family transcriptional regulator [Mycolicibacillus parakoreensis]ULN51533.1 WhiB family transcriptional regulator [Mycolicibacillus parakoreensis]